MKAHKLSLKLRVFFTFIMLPFIICGMNIHADENSSKNVLIINSYHKGLSWTDSQTEGIINILKKSESRCTISIEYMDWKNYPTNENLKLIYSNIKYKYSKKQIDLIVTTDDAALEFALKNRMELFKNAPVVFCGVNEEGVRKITQGYSNVTGIIEKVDPEMTIKAALEIIPNLKNVYVIYDNNESGLSTGALAIQAIKRVAPKLEVFSLNEGTLDEILQKVEQVQKDSTILITTYYMDERGTAVGFEEFSEMVSKKSEVPVFHLFDFGIGHGALGGSMTSGRLQGEGAGKIALRVLQGESISQIPVNISKTTNYIFDYGQLKRFDIPFEHVPKGSKIINKPFSFYVTYRNLVNTVVIVFLLMSVFIFVLIINLRKINRMKHELFNSHTELTKLYAELTASEKILKQKFEELTSARKSLAFSEKRYAALFGKMLNGFFIFEPVMNMDNKLIDIRFISVNPGFEAQTNKKVSDIPGKTWMEVFKYPNRNLDFYKKVLETGEAERFEAYYPTENAYYLFNAFKIMDNQVGVVFDNITEYKQAIKKIRKLNEELELRVAERTDELRGAISELEAFTYTVSHDLKSPLRAIDGYSRIVLEDFEGKLEEEATELIINIRNICKDMIDMINKLLLYDTTARSVLSKEEINTEEMILSIFKELKSTCKKRAIELKIETGLPKVIADRVLLKQVLYNILSNAVKFTKNTNNALITVGSVITEDEYLFYIKDNGVGFDMEYSGKLFGIFQRLHTSDEFEGSGIGLVTIKKIIQKHGGKTWIEGKLGVGATVYFTLPFTW